MLTFHQPCVSGFAGPLLSKQLRFATWGSLAQKIQRSLSEHERKRMSS